MRECEMLAKAIILATERHQCQKRKDDTPYIYHPIKVSEFVQGMGYDYRYQVVAILHDVLEDTDTTDDEIREFGEDVFEAVKLLTKAPGIDEKEYVAAIIKNEMAKVVKEADKYHNVSDVMKSGDMNWAKKYVQKARACYYGLFSDWLDEKIEYMESMLENMSTTHHLTQ